MTNGVFSKIGFSPSQRLMADSVGNREDGALAVRLRYKMVESRTTHSNGAIDLTVLAPHTLTDQNAKLWMEGFFTEAFPNMAEHVRVDDAVDGKLCVHLTGPAASRYTIIMQNLNLAEESIEKNKPLAARG